ncbi:hypothetical protein JMJ35_008151 [Cladonia borealis]|uniref:Uncharacterized protein n=1 Tax=Cladonia borealis TaxID=184061 RepID=A0AA39UZH9_9LECA|nr:hypothetical protein JMJ35_008151 [Cladonia borealis]
MASSHEIRSIEDFIEPSYLEIKQVSQPPPISSSYIRRQGLKQDSTKASEEKVAHEATNMNTNYYRKERKLPILGVPCWFLGRGYSVDVRWQFGVAYVAVESDQVQKVKDKLEGHGFEGSIVHVKLLHERPDDFIPQNWAKSASAVV